MSNPKVDKALQIILTHARDGIAANIGKVREELEKLLPVDDKDTSELEAEVTGLTDENNRLNEKLNEFDNSAKDRQEELDKANQSVTEMTAQAAADKAQLDSITATNGDLMKQVDDLKAQLEATKVTPPPADAPPAADAAPASGDSVAPVVNP